MKRYVRLSYDINVDTPLYPGTPPIIITPGKQISRGDSCNTSLVTISSHTGTHIDAPRHFIDSGRTINDYSQEELVFTKPLIIDCPKDAAEIIEADDLSMLNNSTQADLLLIRTGFHKYREKDIEAYCRRNPSLSAGAARWIRENFPNIRGIGIDCISVSSSANRKMGGETHRILLMNDGFDGAPVLIIEDMRLPLEIKKLREVMLLPLFVEGIDGTPCAVIGMTEE